MDTIKILTGTPTEIAEQLQQILPWPGHEVRSQTTVLTPGGGLAVTLHLRRTHLVEGEYLRDAIPQLTDFHRRRIAAAGAKYTRQEPCHARSDLSLTLAAQ